MEKAKDDQMDYSKEMDNAKDQIENAKGVEEEINDSPIEQVRLTVPIKDDPTLPTLTFRTWVLGATSCALLSFVNRFFDYRQNPIGISSLCVQIAALPIGKLMAATLPTKSIRIPGIKWTFSLNPGPFNMKEHVLITILAHSAGSPYALAAVSVVKAFYHRGINPLVAMLLTQTSQLMGYGCAGVLMKFLVDNPYMWWPSTLLDVSLYRALHEDEVRSKGQLTRLQFFLIALISSFAYAVIPNYFFPSISVLSFVCWIWKDSVTAQQIGSGRFGLGIGSFGLDWSTIAGYTGSPFATPGSTLLNFMAGFIVVVYIMNPVLYWNNIMGAKKFPIFTSHLFDSDGQIYNISRVLDAKTFSFNQQGYDEYSPIYLSTFYAFCYGLRFAACSSTLTYVAFFHGSTILRHYKDAFHGKNQSGDVHNRLMKKYERVPQWWFLSILVSMIILSVITCSGFGEQLQLPYWGLILACGMGMIFIIPVSVMVATTNQGRLPAEIHELMVGYLFPGKPLASLTYKVYSYISLAHAVEFIVDFKIAHYMKIPPKSIFFTQVGGTVISSTVNFFTAWWLLTSVPNICDQSKLPKGSPWTCASYNTFYDSTLVWGVMGPGKMFAPHGQYSKMYYFFIFGAIAPILVWVVSRKFPKKKWIKLICPPLILSAATHMPPATPVNIWSWLTLGILFNIILYRKYKAWWARYTYILSAGLDAGTAFVGILLYLAIQSRGTYGPSWWGLEFSDHCPLAHCPTAPGIEVQGCPIFH
ncbi:oligopeptide transporter 5-like [Tasmannia lanceolata]|uniref:oligopeptide transporter 5-like n=1 Tax=Tasmannia lanceolata TaxID=3420 RepID=UPI0040632ACA